MRKTKAMFSGGNMDTLIDSGVWTGGVCCSDEGDNSIYLGGKLWVHKKCGGICGRLVEHKDFRSDWCHGVARSIE